MNTPPDFRLLLMMVFIIVIFSGLALIFLAVVEKPNSSVTNAQSVMQHAFSAGIGAFIVLLSIWRPRKD